MKLSYDFSKTILSGIMTVVAALSVLFFIPITFGVFSANKIDPLSLKINGLIDGAH